MILAFKVTGITANTTVGAAVDAFALGGPLRMFRPFFPKMIFGIDDTGDLFRAGRKANGQLTKPLAEMTQDELFNFTRTRAEQIRSARLREHDMGGETWDVGVVQLGTNPSSRRVVVTTSGPAASAPRNLLAAGEEFRTPELGTLGARPSIRTPPPPDPIGNAHHAEPRMTAVLQPGENLLAHAPTRGVCDLCQQTIDLGLVPVTHRTPDAYTAWRATQVTSGNLPTAPPRWHRLLQRAQSTSIEEHIAAMRFEARYDQAYIRYYNG